ncbi:NAD-dependent epimerase/dehydratase family protein [Ammoniphilus sp. CFH 90114]|uniref:NAD-dependent epimerase/dehydratase family protein n=1 Tax=Ammoniphilus sp. CFH 90114 TaxID=2493665 RepID=UPI00100F11F5|nr:NAD-dependent epimerase/dehydratase family protein [Ammoniphilus sp. CFH 90114]RXT13971.1 NAD-dependent epimerase/dehydratase family protein [Ammoniphilus sp. CFH 90114]
MKKTVVTGCAGFIGSSLSKRLLDEGYEVIGIDCYTDNYDRKIKEKNIGGLMGREGFTFLQQQILELDWGDLLKGTEYVFHQAAIPGVRTSWGKSFNTYIENNILATQMMLEAAKNSLVKKFIYASSSSIYGLTEGSTSETTIPRPLSPYGVTKLAGEQLCHLYADNYGVPTVSLRYFTVYGPGQRPDMAFHKFIKAMLNNEPITVYGDGTQSRDFTFIDDAVEANLLAARYKGIGEAFNIGGTSRTVLKDVIHLIGKLTGIEPRIQYDQKQAGDPPHTWADITKAKKELGYAPGMPLEQGLLAEIQYIKDLYR